MMKPSLRLGLAVLLLLGTGLGRGGDGAIAATFDQQEVNSNRFIVVASPYGNNAHQLLILEQLSTARSCWREQGNNPVQVEPLLVNFDFTGICGRNSDSNGYSLRLAGEDMGWRYSLRIVKRQGDLLLVAISNAARNAPELLIGRANGMTSGFATIVLEPGWRLTRRVYRGTALGHIYLTHNQPLSALSDPGTSPPVAAPIAAPAAAPIVVPAAAPIVVPSPQSAETNPAPSLLTKLKGNRRSSHTPRQHLSPTGRSSSVASISVPRSSSPASSATSTASDRRLASRNYLFSSRNRQSAAASTPASQSPLSGRRSVQPVRRSSAIARLPNRSDPGISISVPPPETNVLRRSRSPLPPPPPASRGSSAGLLPVPRTPIPLGNAPSSALPPSPGSPRRFRGQPPPASSLASALGYSYRAVVQTRNARDQDKIRSLVPDAFRTRLNGRVVMQVGLFEERAEAEALRRELKRHGLRVKIFPVN